MFCVHPGLSSHPLPPRHRNGVRGPRRARREGDGPRAAGRRAPTREAVRIGRLAQGRARSRAVARAIGARAPEDDDRRTAARGGCARPAVGAAEDGCSDTAGSGYLGPGLNNRQHEGSALCLLKRRDRRAPSDRVAPEAPLPRTGFRVVDVAFEEAAPRGARRVFQLRRITLWRGWDPRSGVDP